MNLQLFIGGSPRSFYNHHQTGPAGAVLFAPPFRDPFNYHYDPLAVMELDLVGAAMHSRFVAEGKARHHASGAPYSTWYNAASAPPPTSTT